jgi:hypothetical protein
LFTPGEGIAVLAPLRCAVDVEVPVSFLRLLALLFVVGLSTQCSCESAPKPNGKGEGEGEGEGEPLDAFDVWRDMQRVMRASPDHREARAAALVAAGDVDDIFAFVRDEVALTAGRSGFYASEAARRWGTQATLRGGMGTMRERADLLAHLLTEAGYTCEVWMGDRTPDFDLNLALAHAPVRQVQWPVDDDDIDGWRAVLNSEGERERVRFDNNRSVENAIRDQITPFDLLEPPVLADEVVLIPFVRLMDGAEPLDLNPNVGPVPSGDPGVLEPRLAPEAGDLDTVRIAFEASRSDQPNAVFTLVERSYGADELVGRTVTAALTPPLGFNEAANTRAADINVFIPILSVRGKGLDANARAERSAVGNPLTRGGDVMTVAEDGTLSIADQDLPSPPTAELLLASVTSAVVTADAAAFPVVELEVGAFDAADQSVPLMAADAFSVRENDEEVSATLLRARARNTRVMLLFDRSSSVPPEFLDNAAASGHAIAEAIFAAVPGSEIQIAGMDFSGPNISGGYSSTIEGVDAALVDLAGAASEVWNNLAAVGAETARGTGPSIVVMISDFVAEDLETAEFSSLVAGGAPVLAVGVGPVDVETAERIAALSGGTTFAGIDASSVAAAAADFAAARARIAYTLQYRSRADGVGPHTVTLGIDAGRVNTTASFDAPAAPVRPRALSGLFVTVETDGGSVRRTLAGSARGAVADGQIEAVAGMLFGRTVLAFEAGPPGLSAKLDEMIDERFVWEPILDAYADDDDEALRTALEVPRTQTPWQLRMLFSSGPEELVGPVMAPTGVSVAMFVEQPQFDGPLRRRLDMVPLSPARTVGLDAEASKDATVARSVYQAAIEAQLFSESTASLLAGETLGQFSPISAFVDLGLSWEAIVGPYRSGYTMIAPVDGEPLAFWAVHQSGAVVGVLPDGSGGGIESEVEQTLREIDLILDIAERAGEMAGFTGIGVWIELERTKAALVGNATIIIAGGEGRDSLDILADAACSAAEDAALGEIPGLDDLTGPLDDLESIYGATETITGSDMPDVGLPSACD